MKNTITLTNTPRRVLDKVIYHEDFSDKRTITIEENIDSYKCCLVLEPKRDEKGFIVVAKVEDMIKQMKSSKTTDTYTLFLDNTELFSFDFITEKKQEIVLKNKIKFKYMSANIHCEFVIPKKVIPMVKPLDVFGVIGSEDGYSFIMYFKEESSIKKFLLENEGSDCYYGEVITFPTYEGSKIDVEALNNEKEFK